MTDEVIIYVDDGRDLPPVEQTGRFVIVVRVEDGQKAWYLNDRVGKPVNFTSGKGTIFQEDTHTPEGEWLLEGDSEPGFCVMMQAERYGETAAGCVEHLKLLRKWEHVIPSLADYEWDDDNGWTAKEKS